MSLSNRSARRRGMIMGAAISSSRSNKRAAAQASSQSQAQPAIQPSAQDPNIEKLKQLSELHKQGILTDEEFAAKKKSLLGI